MNKYTKIFLFLLLALVFANDAFAQGRATITPPTPPFFGVVACKTYNCFFSSNFVLVLSALGIFVLGVTVLTGRIQWITAIVLIVGILLLAGAAKFVDGLAKGMPTTAEAGIANSIQGMQGCANDGVLKCD
jgi:type IV secretory pathway VirB2 component (pilin)